MNTYNNPTNVLNYNNLNFANIPTPTTMGAKQPINPVVAVFEQNRHDKTEKVLHYAVAFTSMKSSTKKEDESSPFANIIKTKNVYCLTGFSRNFIHFQYYSENRELLATFSAPKSKITSIKAVTLGNSSAVVVKFTKKDVITFAMPHDLADVKGLSIIPFGDKNQSVVVNQIVEDIKKKNILY